MFRYYLNFPKANKREPIVYLRVVESRNCIAKVNSLLDKLVIRMNKINYG